MADILIIEENEDERSHLQHHLNNNAYPADAVATLAEGLTLMAEAAANGTPSQMICMGEQLRASSGDRGPQALHQIRKAQGYANVRILGGSMEPNYWFEWKNDPKFVAIQKCDANPAPRMVWDIPVVIQRIQGAALPTRYNLNTAA